MNLEKIIEWCAIILVVILGARWLAGLFGTGDVVNGVAPQIYGPGAPGYIGYPYGAGVVYMTPGIVGEWSGYRGRGWYRGRRGGRR